MTTNDAKPTSTFDYAAYQAQQEAFDEAAGRLLADNKTTLFDLLDRSGISRVSVTFDGYGDSGQIEKIDAFRGDDHVDLPDGEIDIRSAIPGSTDIKHQRCRIAEAIETMAYDVLGQTHGGWEINDGAYGEFVFDVAARSISLDYTERYVATESYTHEF